jgi:hypothetical protein
MPTLVCFHRFHYFCPGGTAPSRFDRIQTCSFPFALFELPRWTFAGIPRSDSVVSRRNSRAGFAKNTTVFVSEVRLEFGQPENGSQPTTKIAKNTKRTIWKEEDHHPLGERGCRLNCLLLFVFFAFSVVQLLSLGLWTRRRHLLGQLVLGRDF